MGSQCAMKIDSELGDFEICWMVRQGCVLVTIIFGVVMDLVMKQSVDDSAGMEWVDGSELGDLDLADDMALLHDSGL